MKKATTEGSLPAKGAATTIRKRLNLTSAALGFLLLLGLMLALWAEHRSAITDQRSDQLARTRIRANYDLTQMSDVVRGALIDSRVLNSMETNSLIEAQRDLAAMRLELESEFSEYPDLIRSFRALNHFVISELFPSYQKLFDVIKNDPDSGTVFYAQNVLPLRALRDRLFKDVAAKIQNAASVENGKGQTMATVGLFVVAAVFLASILIGLVQSKAVAEPLDQLVTALEKMRQGDFTQRLPLTRRDEFGVLNEGVNRLADDLSGLVGQVQKSGIQVNSTASEIAATAREQQKTVTQIAATTTQIGATSKEISATSKQLVKTMNEVAQVSEETAKLANTGQSAIARMESNMRQIMEASRSITAKLAVLNEKANNINSVVTTITKVADQTNLLSLNAAIEAEKAGEYGLGFSVVATEIRRLADQTAVSTYDIEKMVKEMQSAAATGVMGMERFSDEVRRGAEEIRQVSTQLAQIIHQVQTLTPRFQTVNSGMHAQATGAEEISDTLSQLSEAAQQTAESLRQSNVSIARLNEAASGLESSVARFKL
jgi:methyl-accepting chemotaxis protein WspA